MNPIHSAYSNVCLIKRGLPIPSQSCLLLAIFMVAIVCNPFISMGQSSDNPYDREGGLFEGMRLVMIQNKYGFIDEKRKEVVPPKFASAQNFNNGLAQVSMNQREFGFINTKGVMVVPMVYQEFWKGFRDGFTPAKKNNLWGMIDDKGKTIISHKYNQLYYFYEGLAMAIKKDEKGSWLGYVNELGQEVIPFEHKDGSYFKEGLAAVSDGTKWGFINAKGALTIAHQYEDVQVFSEGMAAVKKDGKWGFIDSGNNLLIPAIYESAVQFKSGEAQVILHSHVFFINKAGQKLNPGKWLLTFTKGLNMGEQYWYRGKEYGTEFNEKYKQGFRYTDMAHNLNEPEIFVIMSKMKLPSQQGKHSSSTDRMKKNVEGYLEDNLNITNLAFSHNKWTVMTTEYKIPGETVQIKKDFPLQDIKQEWAKGKFITALAFGDNQWVVVMRKEKYNHQVIRQYAPDHWDQQDLDIYMKKGYVITDLAKTKFGSTVVLTKGTGIKEQLLVWAEDLPIREIKDYWQKGYSSYRTFYLPRTTFLEPTK